MKKRIGVFIDAENIPGKYAAEVGQIVSGIGHPIVHRGYADWTNINHPGWTEYAAKYPMTKTQVDNVKVGTNTADFVLVMDLTETVLRLRIRTVVLVSSDSDFLPLVNRLRENGVTVHGIGKYSISKPVFRLAFTEFHALKEGAADTKPPVTCATTPAASTTTSARRRSTFELAEIILRGIEKCPADPDGWVHGGALGTVIKNTDRTFRYKDYGFKSLQSAVNHLDEFEIDLRKVAEGPAIPYFRVAKPKS